MSTAEQKRRFSRNEFERLTQQEDTQDERRLARFQIEIFSTNVSIVFNS